MIVTYCYLILITIHGFTVFEDLTIKEIILLTDSLPIFIKTVIYNHKAIFVMQDVLYICLKLKLLIQSNVVINLIPPKVSHCQKVKGGHRQKLTLV